MEDVKAGKRVPVRSNEYLVVEVGGGAQMTCPRVALEWQMRYGNPDKHRMVAASALDSYDYLVKHCTKDEAWRRIKLMRAAIRANPETNS
jgi:hypothetical protein